MFCYHRNSSIDGEVSSIVISGKISPSVPKNLPEDKQIVLKFQLPNITNVCKYIRIIKGYNS